MAGISIVIPTFNRAEHLKTAIESAIRQSASHLEVIVVDDGSEDDTRRLVQDQFSGKVRYIRKSHSGAPDTRNVGIENALGEYILWLDDDDILSQDAVKTYSEIIKSYPNTDIIYGAVEDYDVASGKNIVVFDPKDWSKNHSMLLSNLMNGSVIPNPGTVVRKSAYQQIGHYNRDFLRAHDYEFWSRAGSRMLFRKNSNIVCRHRIHTGNLSYGAILDTSFESLVIRKMIHLYGFNKIYPFLESQPPSLRISIAHHLAAKSFYKFGDFHNCMKYLDEVPLDLWDFKIVELRLRCLLFQEKWAEHDELLNRLSAKIFISGKNWGELSRFARRYRELMSSFKIAIKSKTQMPQKTLLNEIMTNQYRMPPSVLKSIAIRSMQMKDDKLSIKLLKRIVLTDPTNTHQIKDLMQFVFDEESKNEILSVRRRLISDIDFNVNTYDYSPIKPEAGNVYDIRPIDTAQEANTYHISDTDLPSYSDHSEFINRKGACSMEKDMKELREAVKSLIGGGFKEAAFWMLERLLESYPEDAMWHYEYAVLAHEFSDQFKAADHFKRAAELAPANFEIQKGLGDIYHVALGRSKDAIAQYKTALDINPKHVETLLTIAHLYVAQHQFESARFYYDQVLRLDPSRNDVRRIISQLPMPNDKNSAMQTPGKLYQTACSLVQEGRKREAMRILAELTDVAPGHAQAHNDLGVLNYEIGENEKAFRHYSKACELEPDNILFQKNLADYYWVERNDPKTAMEKYIHVLKICDHDMEALLGCAHICLTMGKRKDARDFAECAIKFEPCNNDARQILQQLDEMSEFDKVSYDSDEIWLQAQEKAAKGDVGGAIDDLNRLVAHSNDNALIYNDLGVLYYETGDKDNALSCYEKAYHMAPGKITIIKNLADFYFAEQRRIEDAMRLYIKALEEDPGDIECLMAIANVCTFMSRPDDASDFYHRILEIEPWNQNAREALNELETKARSTCEDEFVSNQALMSR